MIAQFLAVAIGIELMVAPGLLDVSAPVTDSFRTAGPTMAAIAFVSAFGITRGLRWANALPAGWLIVAPFVVEHSVSAAANSIVAGVLTVVLILLTGPGSGEKRYGGGWRSLSDTRRLPPEGAGHG